MMLFLVPVVLVTLLNLHAQEAVTYNFDVNATNIPSSCQELYEEFLRYRTDVSNPKYKVIAKRFDERLSDCVESTSNPSNKIYYRDNKYLQFRSNVHEQTIEDTLHILF